jgi:predicted small lipoprotein YifL
MSLKTETLFTVVILIIILSLVGCGEKVDYIPPEQTVRTVTKVEQLQSWQFPEYCIGGVVYIAGTNYLQPKINRKHITNPNLSIYTSCN